MSCEIYNMLTDNSILSGTGSSCRHEHSCPKNAVQCKWGPMLRNIAKNMALEDTSEDLKQDAILSELEVKKEFGTEVQKEKENGQYYAHISISRVN